MKYQPGEKLAYVFLIAFGTAAFVLAELAIWNWDLQTTRMLLGDLVAFAFMLLVAIAYGHKDE